MFTAVRRVAVKEGTITESLALESRSLGKMLWVRRNTLPGS
jgi:hypothetical protein